MNNTKFFLIVCLMAVMVVVGLKCGEYNVIKHQKIEKTETGYLVDFEGNYYEYTED